MKKLFTLLFTILIISTVHSQIYLVDPLEAIYPDINMLDSYSDKWTADFPQGTTASVHILIKTPHKESLTISAMLKGKELGNEVWSQLIDVPVEQNTGIDSRTEQFIDKVNPYVIRRAPFRIFEAIQPLASKTIKTTTNYTALRLTIPFKYIKEIGKYSIEIFVKSSSTVEKGIFKCKIHKAQLPELKDSQFFYTNWFNLSKMEEYHQLKRWSESWYTMLDRYAKMMANGRQNCITIPSELIRYENGGFILEEDKMLRFINTFRKYGFNYFESPHLMYRGDNDDWGDPELKLILTKERYYTPKAKKDIDILFGLIKDFTIKNKLENSWLQHISDEPTAIQAKCYRDIAFQLKSIYPEIKIMEATNDRDSLVGAIDIWCPIINDFQENESFFRSREKLGEKVLVYTCLVPGGPWLNRTLDMEKIRQVYFGWGAAYYNTGGYLHWGLNQYHADPFSQSVVKHPSPIAGPTNFLPAGDTHIIYPGKNGPLSSLRFEAHRIGCEDYELLMQLKIIKPTLYNKLIKKQFRTYMDYNLDLKEYRNTRAKLLRSID